MFEAKPFQDGRGLSESLNQVHEQILDAFTSLETRIFLEPQGEFWSPADHLRHLVLSIRPLALALGIPKPALLLRFGSAKQASASPAEILDRYRQALAAGAQAGSYAPSPEAISGDGAAWRQAVLQQFEEVGPRLEKSLRRWNEEDLDRYQLPHPVLGLLTVREMLFFTLHHNQHHARRVFERLERVASL